MKADDFYSLSDLAFNERRPSEYLILNLRGEVSDFLRVNQSKVRQTGSVMDWQLGVDYLLRTPEGIKKNSKSFGLTGVSTNDRDRLLNEIKFLRDETINLPVDPYAELPLSFESHHHIQKGKFSSSSDLLPQLLGPLKGLDAVGFFAGGKIVRAFCHSEGLKHWFETENFSWDYSIYTKSQRAIKKLLAGTEWNQSTYESQIEEAREALSILEVPAIKPSRGSHRVYLAPAAVSELMGMWSWGCVGESAMRNGESPLLRMRSGEVQLSSDFSLSEDFSNGLVPRFNSEGELSAERLCLVDRGELKSTLISRRSAKEFGLQSTGAVSSESLRSPKISEGKMKSDDVLKTLHNGLYLSNLHYLNWSDQPAGRVTGMTRFSCFHVENGRLKAPIETMRFDDTLFSIFGEALEGLTQHPEWQPETSTYEMRSLGGAQSPGVLLKSFQLTI